jgi:hypothetical protein
MALNRSKYLGLAEIGQGDQFNAEGYAFSTGNIERLDQFIYRLLAHHHNGVAPLTTSELDPPSLTLNTDDDSGRIAPGQTLRYKYTLIDELGTETLASPETTVTIPPAVVPPNAPSLSYSTTGGELTAGTYSYVISAYVGSSPTETQRSDPAPITIPSGTTNLITLTMPTLPAGASGFNIFRAAPSEQSYSFLATIADDEYVDDGTVTPNYNRPPSNRNTTRRHNSVDVTLPGATPVVPEGYVAWRLYRTSVAGNYDNSRLVDVVEETSEGSGIITPTYTDVGLGTRTGSPPTTGAALPAFPKINLGTETEGLLGPGAGTHLIQITLRADGPVETGPQGGFWLANFDKTQLVSATAWIEEPAGGSAVIVDLEQYLDGATPVWTSVFTDSDLPFVAAGEYVGDPVELTSDDSRFWDEPRLFRLNITQGDAAATPTAADLRLTLMVAVQQDLDGFSFDG